MSRNNTSLFTPLNLGFSTENPENPPKASVYDIPIYIVGEEELASCPSLSGGTGSSDDPFLFEGLNIYNASGMGIFLAHTKSFITIRNCTIQTKMSSFGINLLNTTGVNVVNNTLTRCSSGVQLIYAETTLNNVSNNLFIQNGGGIKVVRAEKNLIFNNTMLDNYMGINIQYAIGNIISNNFIRNNNSYLSTQFRPGLLCIFSQENKIEYNDISYNHYGLWLRQANLNEINFNLLEESVYDGGRFYESSAFNNITGNLVNGSGRYGLNFESSSNNQIWNNIFENSLDLNAFSTSDSSNMWDYSGQGNYWDDYNTLYPAAEFQNDHWSIPYEISGSISDQDDFPIDLHPSWVETPHNQIGSVAEPFVIDVNATDNDAIDTYWLTGTSDFTINQTGVISNITILMPGTEYSFTICVNDSLGQEIHRLITISIIDDIIPEWIDMAEEMVIAIDELICYDFNATDNVAIDSFWVNDTEKFSIGENGILQNATIISLGIYSIEVFVNDTTGNVISVTLRISIIDGVLPIFLNPFEPQFYLPGESVGYQVNVSDNVGVDRYWINDTIAFSIDQTGNITNNSLLNIGSHWIEIFVNDTSGNQISTIVKLVVIDNVSPIWTDDFENQIYLLNESIYFAVNVSDNVAVDRYWINDTVRFSIDQIGILQNITVLNPGNYSVEVHVNDTSGNEIMRILEIEIALLPSDPNSGSEGNGSGNGGGNVPVIVASFSIVSIGGVGVILVLKKIKK